MPIQCEITHLKFRNLQGHVKKTMHTYSSSEQQHYSSSSNKKPPSPSPRRRVPSSGPLSSPSTVRKLSPGPRDRKPDYGMMTSSYNYSYSTNMQSDPEPIVQPTPSPAPPIRDGVPTGVSYYNKYHSTHTHQSQRQTSPLPPPATFPSGSTPRPSTQPSPLVTQTPPTRVDELMTELSEFDSSIQHTGFVEPVTKPRDPSPEPYRPYREPSPVRPSPVIKQSSTPGPAVYYPPGEMFTNTKAKSEVSLDNGRGRARGQYAHKSKDKGKYSAEEGKQGAAVVPICLPLCCAAPCVIM